MYFSEPGLQFPTTGSLYAKLGKLSQLSLPLDWIFRSKMKARFPAPIAFYIQSMH